MKLYHIDRIGTLKEGQILKLIKFDGFNDIIVEGNNLSIEFNNIIKDLFDNEISNHGFNYINDVFPKSYLPKLELLYELIRKIKYDNCPSRYKSFYAVEIKDLKRLMHRLNVNLDNCDIYEVESNSYFKADMNLLKGDGKLFDIIYAEKYWNQEVSEEPLFEFLLEYPIKIVKKIRNID